MKIRIALIAAFAAVSNYARAEALDVSGFSRSFDIVVPASSVGEGVTLQDFPALVRLSTAIDGFSYADFLQSNGADLAFTDAEGNVLPHEIDTWKPSGESLVWVKIPSLARGTIVHCYYGSASYSPTVSATGVWSAYAGVWHCNEGSGALSDSSGHGNIATPTGTADYTSQMVATSDSAIGTARTAQPSSTYFAGWSNKASHFVADSPSLRIDSQFVFSGWFKAKEVVGTLRCASTKSDYTEASGWEVEFPDDITRIYVRGGGQDAAVIPNPANAEGRFIHYVFAFNGDTVDCYTNGHLAASGQINPVSASSIGLGIGNNAACTERGWCGWFDEVRYRAGTISAAEAEAEYRMVADRGFFQYGKGDSGRIDPSIFDKAVTFAVNPAFADDSVSGAPVLVRLSEDIRGFDYSDFHDSANGTDLAFTDAYGAILPHETEQWNVGGESLVWVKIPSGAAGTQLTAWYGSGEYTSSGNPGALWNGFTAVWHMAEADGDATDATGNGFTGVPIGSMASSMSAVSDGAVGVARKNCPEKKFGQDGSCLSISGSENWSLGDTFTASGFFRITDTDYYPVRWFRLFSTKSPKASGGWGQETDGEVAQSMFVYGAGDAAGVDNVPSFVGKWVHFTFAYSGSTCAVYTNGYLLASATIDPARDNGQPLSLGSNSDCSEWCLYGDYDEVRIMDSAPSPADIAFSFNAMAQEDFLIPGAAEAVAKATIDVERLSDGSEKDLVPGVFRVSRQTAANYPAFVGYALSGTAVAGADYSTPQEGTVSIPAGSAYADFEVTPLHNAASGEGKSVTIEVDGGAAATLSIANLAPPARSDFKRAIDFTVSAAFLGDETLDDFPVLLRLSTAIPGFTYADFKKAGGGDILFVDKATGAAIPHAIDEWHENGESLVWVMPQTLANGTTFRMYYSSDLDLGGAMKGAPWKGFAGVWHFNEGTWEKPAYDATGHGLDAVVHADYYPDFSGDYGDGGVVGKARWNQSSSKVNIGCNWYEVAYRDALDLGREFIFSGWFKLNEMQYWPRIVSRKNESLSTGMGWEVEVDSTTELAAWAGGTAISATIPDISSGWTHLAFAYGRDMGEGKTAKLTIYANGEEVKSMTSGAAARYYGNPLVFGCSASGSSSFPFNGAFDEFRYRAGAASANWAKAEYLTVTDPAFVTASPVQNIVLSTILLMR